jgi:hypothetical protein
MPFLNTNIPELSGYDTGLCLSNLDILTVRQNRVSESVLAILSELADSLIHDAEGDPDTVDSILLSLQSSTDATDEAEIALEDQALRSVAPVNREAVARMASHTGLHARLLLYRMIEERMPSRLSEEATDRLPAPVPPSARGRVAYMPGAMADKAYLRLTAGLASPRADATASFVDACEEVHSGLAEFCILPLENANNGRLLAFTRLILRYRLQIVAVCDLENHAADGQATRFALLREGEEGRFPPRPTLAAPDAPLCLEIIHLTDSPSLTDLLSAAEFCGLSLARVDTLPAFDELEIFLEESPTATAFACVFRAENDGASPADFDLTTFRRFLSLEAPENILTGFYGAV